MGDKTGISWTSATWNAIRGCSRVSEGCRNCYAEAMAYRFSGPGEAYDGLAILKNGHASWTGKIDFVEKHLLDPIRWKNPRKIFVNSMSDLFHENVTDEMRDKIFAVMALAPQHQFQILTKRPQRMLEYMTGEHLAVNGETTTAKGEVSLAFGRPARFFPQEFKRLPLNQDATKLQWPLPNVWLGVSTEDQKTANERIPILLQTPAAVRFISAEPLLGEIDLCRIPNDVGFAEGQPWLDVLKGYAWVTDGPDYYDVCNIGTKLDWVIAGGESGPNARPCHLAWCSRLKVQCKMAKVAFFMKQLGGNIPDDDQNYIQRVTGKSVHDRKGGDMEEFPPELRVQEYPA